MSISAVKHRVQKFLAEMEAAQAKAHQRERDLLARHREELVELRREIDVVTGKVDALKWSLSQLDDTIEPGAASSEA